MVYTFRFPIRLWFVDVPPVSLPSGAGLVPYGALRLGPAPPPTAVFSSAVAGSYFNFTRFSVSCQQESVICLKMESERKRNLGRKEGISAYKWLLIAHISPELLSFELPLMLICAMISVSTLPLRVLKWERLIELRKED